MASPTTEATRVLNHLMQGESVNGIRFGSQQLLFTSGPGRPNGEPYINLASAWTIFSDRPKSFPASEEEVSAPASETDEYLALVNLRHCIVERVEVLEPVPHLVVSFTDGRLLFVCGANLQYESWQAGLSFSGEENWLVVACPGGEMVAWAPEKFWAGAA